MLGLLITVFLVAFIFGGIKAQNTLAPLRERVYEAHTNIKGIIEKRNRLIGKLLEIAKAYATHEKEIHLRISSDFASDQQIAANPGRAFAYVSRLVNTFPNLRADRTYLDLSSQLTALESELQAKHQLHSAAVREYNSTRASYPHIVYASWWGNFQTAEYLDGTDSVTALVLVE